jgi:hypothetical protein
LIAWRHERVYSEEINQCTGGFGRQLSLSEAQAYESKTRKAIIKTFQTTTTYISLLVSSVL